MNNRSSYLPYLALAAVCIIWGTTYLALRIAVLHFPPFLFTAMRQITAGLLLLVFIGGNIMTCMIFMMNQRSIKTKLLWTAGLLVLIVVMNLIIRSSLSWIAIKNIGQLFSETKNTHASECDIFFGPLWSAMKPSAVSPSRWPGRFTTVDCGPGQYLIRHAPVSWWCFEPGI